jgi:hypothetical protein
VHSYTECSKAFLIISVGSLDPTAPNGVLKETDVASFMVIFRYLCGGPSENHELLSIQLVSDRNRTACANLLGVLILVGTWEM